MNVHGIRDFENNQNNRNNYQQMDNQNPRNNPLLFILQDEQPQKPPEQETFLDMLKYICCPSFSFKQFIILYFIATLVLSPQIQGNFLQPNTQTMISMGALVPYLIHDKYQIYRFITPLFLHANFMHIVSNIINQLIFGTRFEKAVGQTRFIFIYLLSGIGGNVFSALVTDNLSVGASTAINGILAAYVGYLLINWKALHTVRHVRNYMLCIIIFFIMINLLMNLGNSSVNNSGHLGGLIVGFFVSMAIVKPIQPTQSIANYQKIFLGMTIIYFVLCVLLFFLVKDPQHI